MRVEDIVPRLQPPSILPPPPSTARENELARAALLGLAKSMWVIHGFK